VIPKALLPTQVPEPFHSAIEKGQAGDVCDLEASSPEALFGRGMARMQAGRTHEARSDLETASAALGDPCIIELACLDIVTQHGVSAALALAEEILARSALGSPLLARAFHVIGMGKAKLRRTEEAIDALLAASKIYLELGDYRRGARVKDTLGRIHASQGRLDLALTAYAISIVEKSLSGDRYGMAITLGNLGRVHLQCGRWRDALECFELDRRLAEELGDRRGRARMDNDMGRARLGMEDLSGAMTDLRRALNAVLQGGWRDMEFFVRKDLARGLAAQDELDEASRELDLAEAALGAEVDPSLASMLDAARGEILLARKHPGAVELLEKAAKGFRDADLPDQEIPLWITLARAYSREKLKRMGEVCLEKAMARARRDGFERYLRPIREAMAEMGTGEGLVEEEGRLPAPDVEEPLPDGYIVFKPSLGSGAFGEVFRAYDPLRGEIVALKRIRVGKVYDLEKRRELLTSAHLELETAARIRHPGLARVYALGFDGAGNAYVVQEFIKGKPLSKLMAATRISEAPSVLGKVACIAEALEALHAEKIIHRDIKPENILLREPDESPVLVDFGLACMLDAEGGFGATGIGGTFPFIAPDLFRNEPVTAKADMYSLGVLMYEWLAGRLPWELAGKSWHAAVAEKLGQSAAPLSKARPDLPRRLHDLVGDLMDLDPARRPGAAETAAICAGILAEEEGFLEACRLEPDRSTTIPLDL